jgi:pyruvate/2-oxoglutarate dehydrogenase complex dihydrolipoamide acyltransferase (E2) component
MRRIGQAAGAVVLVGALLVGIMAGSASAATSVIEAEDFATKVSTTTADSCCGATAPSDVVIASGGYIETTVVVPTGATGATLKGFSYYVDTFNLTIDGTVVGAFSGDGTGTFVQAFSQSLAVGSHVVRIAPATSSGLYFDRVVLDYTPAETTTTTAAPTTTTTAAPTTTTTAPADPPTSTEWDPDREVRLGVAFLVFWASALAMASLGRG